MQKIMMNEERDPSGDITRVVIRDTPDRNIQVDVFAAGNQTGQEYTRQELRMIRELIANIDLEDIDTSLDDLIK